MPLRTGSLGGVQNQYSFKDHRGLNIGTSKSMSAETIGPMMRSLAPPVPPLGRAADPHDTRLVSTRRNPWATRDRPAHDARKSTAERCQGRMHQPPHAPRAGRATRRRGLPRKRGRRCRCYCRRRLPREAAAMLMSASSCRPNLPPPATALPHSAGLSTPLPALAPGAKPPPPGRRGLTNAKQRERWARERGARRTLMQATAIPLRPGMIRVSGGTPQACE